MIDFRIRDCAFKKSVRKRKKFSKRRNFLKEYEGSHIGYKKLQKLTEYWRYKEKIPRLITMDEFFASYEGRDFQEACDEFIKRYKKCKTKYKIKYPLATMSRYLSGQTSYRFRFRFENVKNNFGTVLLSESGRLGILEDNTIKSFDYASRLVTDSYYSFVKLRRQKKEYISYNARFLDTYMNRINPESDWIQPLGKLYVVDLVTKKVIPEPKMTYVIKARVYSGHYTKFLPKLGIALSTYTKVGIAGEKTIGIMARERKCNYSVYYTLIKKPYVG